MSCNQATDNSAADVASAKRLTMTKALAVFLAPYFTFMRRFQFFPCISHILGRLNVLADELSRFKQPLSVNLDPKGFRDIPWPDLLRPLACLWPSMVERGFRILGVGRVKKNCCSPLTGCLNR